MKTHQDQLSKSIVFTNRARCRDCYRCIRVCPVEAIGIRDGQAFVEPQRCIACGTCIRECPQKAKTYRNDAAAVMDMLSRAPVAATVAPSFAAVFEPWQVRRIPSALRRLGFCYVAETAVGAAWVAQATAEYARQRPDQRAIASACPAVVQYILRYQAQFAPMLAPIVSPMLAHGRALKKTLGANVKVVFIGPCVAKKAEAQTDPDGAIDAVLTFEELTQWFDSAGIRLADLEESEFDQRAPAAARWYALEGGGLKTAGLKTDIADTQTVAVSGIEALGDMLAGLPRASGGGLIEPLFCRQGCVNGPAMPCGLSAFERKCRLLEYAKTAPAETLIASPPALACAFAPAELPLPTFTEEQIRHILQKTGKELPEDQLNCGACGYSTCRQQAIAVLRQMAEPEMCVSHMRRLAESRTDRIMETSPNGIVILDDQLNIVRMNSSFKRLFMCADSVCGKPISYLMDPEPFDRVASQKTELVEATITHSRYGLVCRQIIYALRPERQIVGLFVDLTRATQNKRQYDLLKSQTIQQAQALLTHQVEMAGKIAEFLGQSAAASEKLLVQLMQMAQQHSNADGQ